ncbi:MAG: 3-hydroxyacyl-CoA dehydrogenase family protein [Planctomycetota bacterium]
MEIRNVAVLGAGTMGSGIAQASALAGCRVALFDLTADLARRGLAGIERSLEKGVEKGKVGAAERAAALGRILPVADRAEAVRDADLVVEAAPEDLDLKRRIFQEASAAARPDAILATNTSSLPVSRIAEAAARPERVVGMHFFNPVPVMKLLEVVVGERTAPATVEAARAFGIRLGKEVIVVKDAPGFASSRLGICLGMEAVRMLEQGVASAEDIDKAMVHGYGHPMGPLRLTDVVGLDVRLAIGEHLAKALRAPHFEPPELLRRLVREGKLGRKSGRGFYAWKD